MATRESPAVPAGLSEKGDTMRFGRLLPLVLLAALASCQLASMTGNTRTGSSGSTGSGNSVSAYYPFFTPSTLTVSAGTTVTWTNTDYSLTHRVYSTAMTPVFDSGNITPGQSFSFTFTTAGTFPYECLIHTNMTGTITVTP